MPRTTIAGLVYSAAAVFLGSCASDSSSSSAPAMPSMEVSASDGGSGPPTHPPGLLIERVETPPAFGVAVRDDGLTYFTEVFNGGVGITHTMTRTVDGFIPTGSIPTGVAFSPDGGTAYVTNQRSQNVGVIDVATAQQVATIPTPGGEDPFVVRISPDGSRLFISTNTTRVYIADTQTREIIGTVEVGFAPNAFAVHPDMRRMYVSAFFGGTVTEIDMFTGAVLRTFGVGGTPQDMAVTRLGHRLYVANEAGHLNEINLETGEQAPPIPLEGGGFGIGVTADDTQAYVSLTHNGLVQVFNLQSRMLAFRFDVGGTPRRIGFSQRGHIGAVANEAGFVTFVR